MAKETTSAKVKETKKKDVPLKKEAVEKVAKATILDKIKEAKANSKPRKFKQSWDFSISLKGLDLKKPENRFNIDFVLPSGRGKENKVAVIADSFATEAKKLAAIVITKAELESLAGNKKKIKELANNYDWFLGEVTLMSLVGKYLSPVLGPRGKIPKPVPPKIKIDAFIESAKRSIRLSLKDSPVINATIGTEDMQDEDVARNAEAVLNFVKEKLPKGINNIKGVYIKLTMGRPVKIEI